ncbi:hypothetical protein DFH06DRAFT_141753 [Mycena polygramma]|nr:hypothetical protein DFH06DRAFT_141753 [Mycena polygramma]
MSSPLVLAPSAPLLPSGLEKEIFETTAMLHPESIRTLALVARRVKIWVEASRYRTLYICGSKAGSYGVANSPHALTLDALATLATSEPTVLREHALNVAFVGCDNTVVTKILSECDAISNLLLFFVGHPSHLARLSVLRLERLSVVLQLLFPPPCARDFTHSLFAAITHLDVWTPMSTQRDWEHWSGLPQIPHLSHLSFHDSPNISNVLCQAALTHCISLKVLVIVATDSHLDRSEVAAGDPRLVVVYVSDFLGEWASGAQGGVDYWVRAEQLVEQRRSGMTTSYVCEPDAWHESEPDEDSDGSEPADSDDPGSDSGPEPEVRSTKSFLRSRKF